jgi:Protein of unknown function (DUF2799)
MTSIRTLLACGALLSGCANFTPEQCRSANWYSLGEQDAFLYGLQPQITQIAYQCQKAGVQVSEKEYLDGWAAGDRERAIRMTRSQ